ncbi:MAG: hypothetical protein ISR60_06635 [Anaerolineales bacterium]|nr:hypothetical protein [Anaerolineales bacterium]
MLTAKSKISYGVGIVLVLIVFWVIFGISMNSKLLDPENLFAVTLISERTYGEFWSESTYSHFVTYRPIIATIFKLEYDLLGFSPKVLNFTSLVLLAVLSCQIYDIVFRRSKNMLTAVIPALFFVTDWRLQENVDTFIGAQDTLAGIFGLWALWVLWFSQTKYKAGITFLLLLASFMSKEFGMAFALAVLVFALYEKPKQWKSIVMASFGAVAVFVAIRLVLGLIPLPGEYPSFMNRAKWSLINIASGFIFTFLPSFTGSDGELPLFNNINLPPTNHFQLNDSTIILFQVLPIVVLFLLGFSNKKERKLYLPLFFLIIGNSVLFFYKYAYRFHFIGIIGMYLIVGLGIDFLYNKLTRKLQLVEISTIFLILLAMILQQRGLYLHDYFRSYLEWNDPSQCTSDLGYSPAEIERCLTYRSLCIPTEEYYLREDFHGYYSATTPDTVRLVMQYYEIPAEYCTCLNPSPKCE